MAADDEIVNPATGERIVFRERPRTRDDPLRFDLFVAPGGRVGGFPHKHEVEERFLLKAGSLQCVAGIRVWTLRPGDSLRIPPRTTHFIRNGGSIEAHAEVEARPGDDLESFFSAVFELGARMPYLHGLIPPLTGARLFDEFGMYGPLMPIALQRPMIGFIAALGRARP
jgi:mannose-6-phosphate isomerase-like protein (cupin superfamily)